MLAFTPTFIFTIAISTATTGSVLNLITFSYFIIEQRRLFYGKLFIALTSFDILSCILLPRCIYRVLFCSNISSIIFETASYVHKEAWDLDAILVAGVIRLSGFSSLFLSIIRCTTIIYPFFKLRKRICLLVMLTFYIWILVSVIALNSASLYTHLMYIACLESILNVVLTSASSGILFVTINKIHPSAEQFSASETKSDILSKRFPIQSNDPSRKVSLENGSTPPRDRKMTIRNKDLPTKSTSQRASTTILILSVLYCFTTTVPTAASIWICMSHVDITTKLRYACGLWLFYITNAMVNPAVLIARSRKIQNHTKTVFRKCCKCYAILDELSTCLKLD